MSTGPADLVAVTGATGNVGRALVAYLAEAGRPTRLLVRDPARTRLAAGAMEAVVADLDRPETLPAALDGVTALFLLSPGPDTPAQDAAAIEAAGRAGVRHVVLLSSLGVELGGIGGGRAHQPGEAALQASGLAWTVLRPSEFMTNALWWLGEATGAGTVSLPTGTGRVAMVAPSDIAAVADEVLSDPAGHQGRTYRLTGPALLTTGQVATALGAALDRPVRHVDIDDAAYRAAATRAGLPAPLLATLAEYYAAQRDGRMEVRTDDVQLVTRRPATPFAAWVRGAVQAGR